MTDINKELFRRYAPKKKLDIINNLTEQELLNITQETIIRVIKEVGTNRYKSRNKDFRFKNKGNNWNSVVNSVSLVSGKLYICLTLLLDDTDPDVDFTLSEFMSKDRFTYYDTDRYGNKYPVYITYGKQDKAKLIRSLLTGYIELKYKK